MDGWRQAGDRLIQAETRAAWGLENIKKYLISYPTYSDEVR